MSFSSLIELPLGQFHLSLCRIKVFFSVFILRGTLWISLHNSLAVLNILFLFIKFLSASFHGLHKLVYFRVDRDHILHGVTLLLKNDVNFLQSIHDSKLVVCGLPIRSRQSAELFQHGHCEGTFAKGFLHIVQEIPNLIVDFLVLHLWLKDQGLVKGGRDNAPIIAVIVISWTTCNVKRSGQT